MAPMVGEFITETFDYDGGRQVTVYLLRLSCTPVMVRPGPSGVEIWSPLRCRRR